MEPLFLDLESQLNLLESRGIKITDRSRNLKKLEHISYYRIKEFAAPFLIENEEALKYDVSFEAVVKRYYQDKNLRINLLHAIEKIEVSLKRNISYILGEKCGAFGYLDFSRWGNRSLTRYELEKKQFYFKKDLLKLVSKSSLRDLKQNINMNEDGFPSIWLATEVLMFGNLITLVELMTTRDKIRLARYYNCAYNELISWIKCLNFVRNICAHNSNIIDIKLKTKPKIRSDWKGSHLSIRTLTSGEEDVVSDKLSVIVLIVITLVREINPNYQWKSIRSNISSICNADGSAMADRGADMIGFANSSSAIDLVSFAKK